MGKKRKKKSAALWTASDAAAFFLLVLLSWALRALLVNDGLFHHDAVCLAESVEASHASGTLEPLRLQEPPVEGRHGLVLVNWGLYSLAALAGQESSESTLLFSATLFGALAVGMLFAVARELALARPVAVAAGILLSLSPVFFSETVGAKGHGLALFIALTGLWFAFWSARHRAAPVAALAGMLVAATGFVRVPAMLAVIAALPPLLVVTKERGRLVTSFVVGFGLIATAVLLVEWSWITRFASVTDSRGVNTLLLSKVAGDLNYTLTPLGILLAVGGAATFWRTPAAWGLIAWMVIGVGYAANLGQYSPRFLIEPLAVAVLFVAAALGWVAKRWAPALWIGALLIALVPFVRTWPVIAYRHDRIGNKVVADVLKEKTPPDAVVIAMDDAPFVRYYAGREAMLHPIPDPEKPVDTRQEVTAFAENVARLITSGRRVFLLKTGLTYDPGQVVSRVLNGNFDIVEVARVESEDYHHRSISSGIFEQVIYEIRLPVGG